MYGESWHSVTIGMLVAVVLVGAMPLFAKVNTTASIRSIFANSDSDLSSSMQATIETTTASAINQTLQQLKRDYQQKGGPFFDLPPDVSLHITFNPTYSRGSKLSTLKLLLFVHGYDTAYIASHIHLLQGRLPQTPGKTTNYLLEIALTEDNAAALGAYPGSTYTILADKTLTKAPITSLPITLKVVGIIQNLSPTAFEEPFWHGDDLNYQPSHDNVIASNAALLALFNQLSSIGYEARTSEASLSVYFPFDISAISSDTLNELQPRLAFLTNEEPSRITSLFVNNANIDKVSIDNTTITVVNSNVKDLTTVVQLPVLTVLGLMVGLSLFFVLLMTELLVTQQAEAIALMRSRGATVRQIFLVFVMQSLLLGLLTVLIGPFLIPLILRAMVYMLFPPIVQSALNVLPTTFWGILFALGWSLWLAVLLVVLTMCLTIWRTLRKSTLGRSITLSAGVQRPLWQRLNSDVVVTLLGVLTYGLSTYLISIGIITAQLQVLLVAPCMLMSATFFCIGATLLSLRMFFHLVNEAQSWRHEDEGSCRCSRW